MTARLVVQAPGEEARGISLEKSAMILGRDRECDLVLDYDYVSRHHARLEQAGADFAIIDLESTNGTFLNGQQVEGKRPLTTGDRIDIGDLSITFFDSSSLTETRLFRPVAGECPIRCDASTRKVWVRGQQSEEHFHPEEFQLINLLTSRYGRVCTREDLGAAIWGRGSFDYGKLADLVRRVKEKLGTHHAGLIEGVPGRGYKIAERK